ncbi:hypothetical protein DFJ77DRAFT_128713 [Powellomyces hirtus]|nr:hypothetical protein DFJ77DRAFT_128713 [Powellomyces hirtus]
MSSPTSVSSVKHAAVIMGATGAVGKAVVREVMEASNFTKVTLLLRRELDYNGPNKEKMQQKIVDFDNLDENLLAGHDVFFCTFGTTRAQAGSAEAFEKIDRDYVLNAAKLFKSANASTPLHFLYCSSGGAKANSWFLYPRVKGQIEEGLKALKFAQCSIFRPAFLLPEEKRNHSRMAEDLVHPIMNSGFGKWTGFSTPVGAVAKAMRVWALGEGEVKPTDVKELSRTFENKEILAMAESQ